MRYDADHKQKSRERILKEAAKAVRAEGPHQIGVASVMGKAGLTHGAFYAHFSSKDALVAAAIDHMFDDSVSRCKQETLGLPAARGLSSYIDWYLSARHRDQRAQGCPMAALASDVPRLSTEAKKAFANGVRRFTEAVGTCLSDAGYIQPEEVAQSVVHELVGAISLARCETDRERSLVMLASSRQQIKTRLGLE